MAGAVMTVIESTESKNSLLAIGSDGTNSNTGQHSGALRYLWQFKVLIFFIICLKCVFPCIETNISHVNTVSHRFLRY